MRPLVSILVPAYNADRWIADTLRSALSQTWERKEIIVIDDGSGDRTLPIARSFESDILKVYSQSNCGAAAARNAAFAKSRGDYIQWLDADDLLDPDKVTTQMAAIEDSPNPRLLLSSEWARFLHRPTHSQFVPTALWSDLPAVEWLMRKMEMNVFMQTATWLVSRELSEKAGPWDTRLAVDDDGEYFCRVLMASEGVRFVPGSKVYYRQPRTGSVSYIGSSNKKRDALWLSMKLHISYLRSMNDSERARAACVAYLQSCLPLLHPERPDLVAMAQGLAASLGGKLELPRFPRQYILIDKIFGWRVARKMQRHVQRTRRWCLRNYDRLRFRLPSGPGWHE